MANDYDISEAFRRIENELITSMLQNMKRHKDWEDEEGFQWSMWQVEQLKALEKYKQQNLKKYSKQFDTINVRIEETIKKARESGNMEQEIEILEAINKGFKPGKKVSPGASAQFFRLNTKKLEALITATTNDLEKAEHAMLRKANDEYRKIIFNAQVYANTGAATYEKAVDMAAKEFLARGINCVEYSNGSKHSLRDYSDMAIRTASKRAKLVGEGEKRAEWGISTVIMNKRGNPCPKCLPFCGKVLIDDVWSGGSKDGVDPETGKKYPTMSYAIECGLYHPRCKDGHTTYFPGISTADDTWTEKELEDIGLQAKQEVRQQYAKRQAEKFERLAKYSLDEENQSLYTVRKEQWRDIANAPSAIQKATTIKELENAVKEVTEADISLAGTDLELMKKNMEQLSKLCEEYGVHFSEITSTAGRRYLGDVQRTGRYGDKVSMLYPKKYYKDKEALLTELKKTATEGSIPKIGGRNIDIYTTTHEFAHTLSERLTSTLYGKDEDFWDEIESIYFDYKKNGRGVLGKYASTNQNEFLAEAFAEAKLGVNPSEYSSKVLGTVDKYFGKSVVKSKDSGIIEMYRKADSRSELKFISDKVFNNLTISVRKKGAVIIRGTKEAEEHLEKLGAAAANVGDVLIFRKDVCVSEVLEETYHFQQNLEKMNGDKEEPLRSILNEIDAKQYLLENSDKYKIPRNEVELTKKQLESYKKQLEEYREGGRWYGA